MNLLLALLIWLTHGQSSSSNPCAGLKGVAAATCYEAHMPHPHMPIPPFPPIRQS